MTASDSLSSTRGAPWPTPHNETVRHPGLYAPKMASQRWLAVCSSKKMGVPPNSSFACRIAVAVFAQRLPFNSTEPISRSYLSTGARWSGQDDQIIHWRSKRARQLPIERHATPALDRQE